MYHQGEGTRPCPFPVTGNGHERVTELKADTFGGRNLETFPEFTNRIYFSMLFSAFIRFFVS